MLLVGVFEFSEYPLHDEHFRVTDARSFRQVGKAAEVALFPGINDLPHGFLADPGQELELMHLRRDGLGVVEKSEKLVRLLLNDRFENFWKLGLCIDRELFEAYTLEAMADHVLIPLADEIATPRLELEARAPFSIENDFQDGKILLAKDLQDRVSQVHGSLVIHVPVR